MKCLDYYQQEKLKPGAELSWDEAIWGRNNRRTNQLTNGRTKSLIEALTHAQKLSKYPSLKRLRVSWDKMKMSKQWLVDHKSKDASHYD
jgi:hypothetical protein